MLYIWSNFATSTLLTSIVAADAQLVVSAGDGSLFPTPGLVGEKFAVVLENDAGTLQEVVECTARSGDVLTITRACEGTAALDWDAGTIVRHEPTADALTWMSRAALDFNRKYLGPAALPPVTDANGDELVPGCMYYDTQERDFFYWDGFSWLVFAGGGGGGGATYFTDLADAPAYYTNFAGYLLQVNETEDGIDFISRPFVEVSVFQQGLLEDGMRFLDHSFAEDVEFPEDFTLNQYRIRDAATAPTEFTIYKNDVEVGTMTVTGTSVVCDTLGLAVSFSTGDTLTVEGPATADLTLGNITANFVAIRTT